MPLLWHMDFVGIVVLMFTLTDTFARVTLDRGLWNGDVDMNQI